MGAPTSSLTLAPSTGSGLLPNTAQWLQMHSLSARQIVAADLDNDGRTDLVIDFGPHTGFWALLNTTQWLQMHSLSARQIVAADLDNNGRTDLVIDFGPQYRDLGSA